MPEKATLERAKRDQAAGKAPSTQAGEFVREEMDHIREGKHGARSTKQAIAIGLSKARRAGVKLPAPRAGKVTEATRRAAARDTRKGAESPHRKPSRTRSRAVLGALKREGTNAASHAALSRQAHSSARPHQRGAKQLCKTGGSDKGTRGPAAGRAKSRAHSCSQQIIELKIFRR